MVRDNAGLVGDSPTSFGLQGTTDSCQVAGMYTGTVQAGGGGGGGGY
jgi:hypothetical protein